MITGPQLDQNKFMGTQYTVTIRYFLGVCFLCMVLFLSACSDDDGPAGSTDTPADFDGTGKVSLGVGYPPLLSFYPRIHIFDSNGNKLQEQQFTPNDLLRLPKLTIEDIPSGRNRILVLLGIGNRGGAIGRTVVRGITIRDDQETDLGTVILKEWASQITFPEEGMWLNDDSAIKLSWPSLKDAMQYHVRISYGDESILDAYTKDTNYIFSSPLGVGDAADSGSVPETGYLPFPGTGQTNCYDNMEQFFMSCPEPGEAFFGQDGYYAVPQRSLTALDIYGNAVDRTKYYFFYLSGVDEFGLESEAAMSRFTVSWAMIRDNTTGLIWEVKTTDGSVHDASNQYDWEAARSQFIDTLNEEQFGFFEGSPQTPWRLPTVQELCSLANLNESDPAIEDYLFLNTNSYRYWAADEYVGDPLAAWAVDFEQGKTVAYNKTQSTESAMTYVRAVRGGPPYPRLVDNGDGTITDTVSRLMWQKEPFAATVDWEEALAQCEALILNKDGVWTFASPNAAGVKYDDWRLPNRNELQSIVNYAREKPAADTSYFPVDSFPVVPGTAPLVFWTATTNAAVVRNAWTVDFNDGMVRGLVKIDASQCYYRAVRAIPEN